MKYCSMKYSINVLVILVSLSSYILGQTPTTPGTRLEHCLVVYNDTLYLLGGSVAYGVAATLPNNGIFYSAPLPLTTSNIKWNLLPQNGFDPIIIAPGCIVEEDLGLLIVIHSNNGLQVYNFNTQEWNNFPRPVNPPALFKNTIYLPRATWIAPKLLFIWTGLSRNLTIPNKGAYTLDLNKTPWELKEIDYNVALVSTNSAGLATIKDENVLIFGGQAGFQGDSTSTFYIYNQRNNFIIPNFNVPTKITDCIVGQLGTTLYILVTEGSQGQNQGMELVKFDLKTFNFGQVVIPSSSYNSANLTLMRDRLPGVQPPGSDAIILYGGTTIDGRVALDSMLIFNLTTESFTQEFNLVRGKGLTDDYTLPVINGVNLSAQESGATPNNSNNSYNSNSSNPNSGNNSNLDSGGGGLGAGGKLGLEIGIPVFLIIISIVVFFVWKKRRTRLPKDRFPGSSDY